MLTAAAGMIDVVGFIELGGFYTSFMSGNTTQLGAGLAHVGPTLFLPAGLIAMFIVGSFLGSLVSTLGGRRRPAAGRRSAPPRPRRASASTAPV